MTQPAGLAQSARIAALVLAGGRGSRLGGAAKPDLVIAGRSLLATVSGAAVDAGASSLVIVGPPRPGLDAELVAGSRQVPAVEFTMEDPPGAGPVAALRAGLRHVAEPWLLLLAADLPFLRSAQLLTLLAEAELQAAPGALLVDDQRRPQWLVSCWRSGRLRSELASYRGASLGGVLGPLRPAEVSITQSPGQPPPWLDCDTGADLAAARAFAQRLAAAGSLTERDLG